MFRNRCGLTTNWVGSESRTAQTMVPSESPPFYAPWKRQSPCTPYRGMQNYLDWSIMYLERIPLPFVFITRSGLTFEHSPLLADSAAVEGGPISSLLVGCTATEFSRIVIT